MSNSIMSSKLKGIIFRDQSSDSSRQLLKLQLKAIR